MMVMELVVVLTTFKLVTVCVVRVCKMEEYNGMANRDHLVCEWANHMYVCTFNNPKSVVRLFPLVKEQQSAVASIVMINTARTDMNWKITCL